MNLYWSNSLVSVGEIGALMFKLLQFVRFHPMIGLNPNIFGILAESCFPAVSYFKSS